MSNLSAEAARLSMISNDILISGGLPIFICGLIGNLIDMVLFTTHPRMNQMSTSIFLATSYSGSFITLLTGLLPQLVYRLTHYDPLAKYEVLCKLRWFLGVGTATVAVHSLCFATVNQFLVTTNSVRCRNLITKRRAIILCTFIYIYCAGLLAPNLFYYKHVLNAVNQTICDVPNPIVSSYNAYTSLIIYTLIPMSVLILFSLLTLKNIRKQLHRRLDLEKTVTRVLFAQVIIVLIATVAYCIRRIYQLYTANIRKDAIRIAQDDIITSVSTLFGFSIHGFTFIVFFAISDAFRSNVLSLRPRRQRRVGCV